MLQDTNLSNVSEPIESYPIFLVGPLYILHYSISKKLREGMVAYLSFYEKNKSPSPSWKYRKNLRSSTNQLAIEQMQ